MSEDGIQSERHLTIRSFLRVGGPIFTAVGLVFFLVGVVSFFSSFGGAAPPRLFWCAFVGLPLLFVGSVMCMYGYLGTYFRYVAGETAPVAKDVVNYLGKETQPGVKAVAKAVTEGILEAKEEEENRSQ